MSAFPGDPKTQVQEVPRKPAGAARAAVLPQNILRAMVRLEGLLEGQDERWAIGGDAAELVLGVFVEADRLEVYTSKKGGEAIALALSAYQVLPPKETEKPMEREAMLDGKPAPAFVKSDYAEYTLDGVKVEVYGDLRIRIGERDWSDPLQFEPTYANIIGHSIPFVPLELKSKVYSYLGDNWADRAEMISEAKRRAKRDQFTSKA